MKPLSALTLLALLLLSCGEKDSAQDEQNAEPTIAVVNYPLAYFAERLAGDFANILFEAPPDEDPAFWKPTDAQIARMQKADLIFLNGATYAKWTASTSLPFEATVDTSASFEDRFIKVEDAVKHAHGKDEAEHSHGGTAFTTWMDFSQAAAQARTMAEAIVEQWPDKKAGVEQNAQTLLADLARIDGEMKFATHKLKGAPVIASHPVYQYWARAYDLQIVSLMWEPEMDLDDDALAELKKVQEANPGARYFIWEGEPAPGHIDKLKALGLSSLVIPPCGNRPESGDLLSVMKASTTALEALPAQ